MKNNDTGGFECSDCGASFETNQGLLSHEIDLHYDKWLRREIPLFVQKNGYERWHHTYDGEGKSVYVHQLLACLDYDPHDVFAEDANIHHGNDGNPRLPECEIPWANWEGNLEVMTNSSHRRYHQSIPDSDLLDELNRLANDLERTPIADDMKRIGAYSCRPFERRFGGWNNALEAAGMEPKAWVAIPRSHLLMEMWRLRDELGKTPTARDMDDDGEYSKSPYERVFGSWSNAKEEAFTPVMNGTFEHNQPNVLRDLS